MFTNSHALPNLPEERRLRPIGIRSLPQTSPPVNTTVEVWTRNGLVTFYVLALMHLKTRRVHIAGITPSPNARWMKQVCRNLNDCEHGCLKDASHLIVDRDTRFIAMRQFLEQNTDTEVVLLPPKSPNLNAYMERWFRSLKTECLDHMIFFGRKSLENAVHKYV